MAKTKLAKAEIVQPGHIDQLLAQLREVDPDQLRVMLRKHIPDVPEPELGRMLLSGVGAAIGSTYRVLGAGAGGSIGALLYEVLKARYWKDR